MMEEMCPRCGGFKVWVAEDDYERQDGTKGNNYYCPECLYEWDDEDDEQLYFDQIVQHGFYYYGFTVLKRTW